MWWRNGERVPEWYNSGCGYTRVHMLDAMNVSCVSPIGCRCAFARVRMYMMYRIACMWKRTNVVRAPLRCWINNNSKKNVFVYGIHTASDQLGRRSKRSKPRKQSEQRQEKECSFVCECVSRTIVFVFVIIIVVVVVVVVNVAVSIQTQRVQIYTGWMRLWTMWTDSVTTQTHTKSSNAVDFIALVDYYIYSPF